MVLSLTAIHPLSSPTPKKSPHSPKRELFCNRSGGQTHTSISSSAPILGCLATVSCLRLLMVGVGHPLLGLLLLVTPTPAPVVGPGLAVGVGGVGGGVLAGASVPPLLGVPRVPLLPGLASCIGVQRGDLQRTLRILLCGLYMGLLGQQRPPPPLSSCSPSCQLTCALCVEDLRWNNLLSSAVMNRIEFDDEYTLACGICLHRAC